jgi:hypothetical protein
MDFKNVHSGWAGGIDEAFESGSYVRDPGHARSLDVWQIVSKPNYTAFVDYGNITPNYNPIDGFTAISDTRGLVYDLNITGGSRSIKNYALNVGQDRFLDQSGAVHQSDTVGTLNATLKDQFSISIAEQDGELRSYTTAAPGPLGCNDPSLARTAFTGFPNYYCGRTDKFEQFSVGLGYRDGTQAPTDFSYAEGPFGGTFLQQYSLSATRQLGRRFSIAAQFGGTEGRSISGGTRSSQWLRLISLGDNLGPDSNVALEVRSVSGTVNGLTTVPGVNLAVSYHSRFASGNEFYMAFGTPAATQTLNRFIVKYVFHAGPQT